MHSAGAGEGRRAIALGALATAVANVCGGVVVFVLLAFVLPTPSVPDERSAELANLVWALCYGLFAAVVGVLWGLRDARRRLAWLGEDRPPDRRELRRTLRLPLALTRRQLVLWTVGAALFAAANAPSSALLATEVGITVLIGGLTTSASSYILLELAGRRVVARALDGRHVSRRPGAGVAWRTVLTWGLGTGLPLGGLTLLAGLSLGLDISRRELALATFVLGLTSLATGLLSITLHARAIAHPLRALRHSLEQVEQGDLDIVVAVTSTTEVGVLQAGVNRMVEGLRERDRVRDLFGRHVGHEVAQQAIDSGATLGGRLVHVAALFVDLVDSTTLAEGRPPDAVLDVLNAFVAVVVEEVDAHGGIVNKFLGDAVLAVWGAPLDHEDPAGAALATARRLGERLPVEVPSVSAGIGVAAGEVVAGNLGTDERLEFTVIGDPVNVAARLSTEAKDRPGAVVADADAVLAAAADERACWREAALTTLRGRSAPTRTFVPATAGTNDG